VAVFWPEKPQFYWPTSTGDSATVPLVTELFSSRDLRRHYHGTTGERRMRRCDLETDLCVMVKNMSTATPTLLTSLSGVVAAEPNCLGARLCAAPVLLADALRASTAAPGLFAPAVLPIGEDGAPAACVDGGATPFNDPALLIWTLISDPRRGLGWERLGVDLLSIGGGRTEPRYRLDALRRKPSALLALSALKTMIVDGERQAEAMLRSQARPEPAGAAPGGLRYRKHDMPLSREFFEEIGLNPTREALRRVRDISDPRGGALRYEAAAIWAEREMPVWPLADPAAPTLTSSAARPGERRDQASGTRRARLIAAPRGSAQTVEARRRARFSGADVAGAL
ncbi:MAG: hypothetical protein AAGM38_17050, partial [Pseudomonadota bacterium]